jgi:mRNA interferase HigB
VPSPPTPLPSLGEGSQSRRIWRGEGDFVIVTLIMSTYLETWYLVTKNSDWSSLEDVRQVYRDAEAVGNFTVFNVKGNSYRLIVGINYVKRRIYFKYFLTHAEYDKDFWKNDPNY